MAKEYTLEFMIKDDGRVICVYGARAAVLNSTLAGYARRLIEEFQPEDRRYPIAVPARSLELAEKANGPEAEHRKYPMSQALVTVLSNMAPFDEPLTPGNVVDLCSMPMGTTTSKLSMLTTNGYLTRVDKGKYLVSSEGHAFLRDHHQ